MTKHPLAEKWKARAEEQQAHVDFGEDNFHAGYANGLSDAAADLEAYEDEGRKLLLKTIYTLGQALEHLPKGHPAREWVWAQRYEIIEYTKEAEDEA